jgi:hypothetical protein
LPDGENCMDKLSGADIDRLIKGNRADDGNSRDEKQPNLTGEVVAPIAGAELLSNVYTFTGHFIAYPSDHAHIAHVLWIAHTHLMDAWESTPRLAFLSPEPSSGKTRALEISELLVPNPVEAINVTPAYLSRKVGDEEKGPPTILYDEIDTVFGPKAKENEEIRGLLNAGHRRGAVAGRCVVHGKKVETEEIPAYCAVALAGLGWLPDTILTRSVIIRMRRRAPGETVTPFRRRVYAAEGHKLQRRLAAWAARLVDAMTAARPEMPPGIEDRDADVWEPLLAIADAAGGQWPKRAREAATVLVGAAKEAEPSLGVRLLADLKTVFDKRGEDKLATLVVLTDLISLPESPWGDLKGKPITDRTLASKLRQYGVKSRDIYVQDRALKGYTREDVHDVWIRYLPSSIPHKRDERDERDGPSDNAHFTRGNLADGTDNKREEAAREREDLADASARNDPKRDENIPTKSSDIADLAYLADVRGIRGNTPRTCAQCNAGGEPLYELEGTDLWLHLECRRFWLKAHPEYRANGSDPGPLPVFLNRTVNGDRQPALGPVGNSLDELQ